MSATAPWFERLRQLIAVRTGHVLQERIEGRLQEILSVRVQAVGAADVGAYVEMLTGGSNELARGELQHLINIYTIGTTSFFRYAEHVELVCKVLVPRLHSILPPTEAINIWSAACSTGEEPYSLAMQLDADGWMAPNSPRQINIVGSDINTESLEVARSGRVDELRLRSLPRQWHRYVDQTASAAQIDESLRSRVSFRYANLVADTTYPRAAEGWHIVVCANVLFYFDDQRAQDVMRRLLEVGAANSVLLLGGAEALARYRTHCEMLQWQQTFGIVRGSWNGLLSPWTRPPAVPLESLQQLAVSCAQPGDADASRSAKSQSVAPDRAPTAPMVRSSEPRLREAIRFAKAGNRQRAIGIFEDVAMQEPDNARCLRLLGITLLRDGQFDKACTALARAAELDTFAFELHFCFAFAHAMQGNSLDAVAAYRRCLFLAPDFVPARHGFALELHRSGDFVRASEEYQRAIEILKGPNGSATLGGWDGAELFLDHGISRGDMLYLLEAHLALSERGQAVP